MSALRRRHIRTTLIYAAAASLLLTAAVWLYRIDPEQSLYSPKCIFYHLTGLKCPGCGSQRAAHALLHLRLGEAFRHNALMTASLPFIALLLISYATRRRLPVLYARLNSSTTMWIILTVIVIWWIMRNIFQF